MSLVRRAWVLAAGAAIVALGCGDETLSTTGGSSNGAGAGGSASNGTGGAPAFVPTGFSCSGATPTLSNDVLPITTANCTGVDGCHLQMHIAGGVYDFLVNRIAEECFDGRLMANPGDAEHSYVIHKMTNRNLCGVYGPMPAGGEMLAADDIQVMYDWICSGAPND
jgi:hypothetical protein